jgi:serine phosphatase RsbU (regulator of sigma subunit)
VTAVSGSFVVRPVANPEWRRLVLDNLIVAVLYVAATRVGFALAFANSQVSPVWPPEGVALAALLVRGHHTIWGVFVGAAVGNFLNLPNLGVALGIGIGNSLGALLNAHLVRRFIGAPTRILSNLRSVVRFAVVCTPVGSALSAVIGVGTLFLAGYVAEGTGEFTWITWWFGEMQGFLIVGVALTVLLGGPARIPTRRQSAEFVSMALSLGTVAFLVFASPRPFSYAPLPFLIWASLRFRHLGAVVATLILSGFAIVQTTAGAGPFASVVDDTLQLSTSLIQLQAYLALLALTAYVVVGLETARDEAQQQRDRMETELKLGQKIQTSMLPPQSMTSETVDIGAAQEPARQVGGDLYDFFFDADQRRLWVIVGDVSDKGVPAALFMSNTMALLRSVVPESSSLASGIERINAQLSRNNERAMFVTLFAAQLDTGSGELVYTNAGHNPPYVVRRGGALERIADRHGPVLGAMAPVDRGEGILRLESGDTLVLFTDGVVEAMNARGELFTEERLVESLARLGGQAPEQAVSGIIAAVRDFEDGVPPADDTTVLVLRYKGPEHAVRAT